MMHYIQGLLMFLTFQFAFGQEVKLVTKKLNGYKEEYSVLTADKKIKQGQYKKYNGKGQLVIEGTYDNNKKIGEWNFYNLSGELEQAYNFTTEQLKHIIKPNYLSKVMINGVIQDIQLDTAPTYLASKVGLNEELNKVMTYPNQALRMGIEGRVAVSVWVTENNEITDVKIIQSVPELNGEVIKGITKAEKYWIAGTKDGNKIKSELVYVLEFSLNYPSGNVTIKLL